MHGQNFDRTKFCSTLPMTRIRGAKPSCAGHTHHTGQHQHGRDGRRPLAVLPRSPRSPARRMFLCAPAACTLQLQGAARRRRPSPPARPPHWSGGRPEAGRRGGRRGGAGRAPAHPVRASQCPPPPHVQRGGCVRRSPVRSTASGGDHRSQRLGLRDRESERRLLRCCWRVVF